MKPEAIVDLGKGNTHLLPGAQPSGSGEGQARPTDGSDEDMTDGVDVVDGIGPDASADGVRMVVHKGALIDVAKLLQQIAQAELAREQTEQRINELIRANGDLQSSGARAKDKIKDLQSELKSSNRKLSEAESNFSGANVSSACVFQQNRPIFCSSRSISPYFLSRNSRKRTPNTMPFCPVSTTKLAQCLSSTSVPRRKTLPCKCESAQHLRLNCDYSQILLEFYRVISPFLSRFPHFWSSIRRDKDRKDREKERTSSAAANKDGKEGKERDACKKEPAREKDVKDKELKGKEARDKSAADVKAEPNGKAVKGKEIKDKGGAEKGHKVNDKDVPFNNINSNVVSDEELTEGDTVKVVNEQVKQLGLTETEPIKADESAGADVAIQHDVFVE